MGSQLKLRRPLLHAFTIPQFSHNATHQAKMLTIYQAAYEGKLFIVQQMLEKEEALINSFDEVRNNQRFLISDFHIVKLYLIGWT